MRHAIESLISLLSSEEPDLHTQGLTLLSALSLTPPEAAHILAAESWSDITFGALPLSGVSLTGCSLTALRLTGSDLSGATLTEATLSDLDLTEADLTGADLQGASLSRCVFWEADLTDADLRGAVLTRVSFAGAVLTGIDLRGALLKRCRLVGLSLSGLRGRGMVLSDSALRQCDLSGADLRKLRTAPGCDLRASRLVGADLSGADLRGVSLAGADLTDADLSGADLSGADLRDVNLTGADLTGAALVAVDLRGALLPASVRLRQCLRDDTLRPGADLRDWRLEDRSLCGADLRGADLSGADLTGADLRGSDLTDATLTGAFLCEADLRGATLTGADLSDADLRRADLRGTNLRLAQRWRVDARWALVDEGTVGEAGLIGTRRLEPGADLRGWYARRLDLSGVDLSGARLHGSVLAEVDLRGARLRGLVRRNRWRSPLSICDADLRGAVFDGLDIDAMRVDLRDEGRSHPVPFLLTLHSLPSSSESDQSNMVASISPGAELDQALLADVDLSGEDLSGASLRGADLTDADLTGADLTGADLSGAFLDGSAWDAETRWPRPPPPPARRLPPLRGSPWAGSIAEPTWLEDARWIPLWDGAHALQWDGRRWHRSRHRQTQRSRSRILTDRGTTHGERAVVDLSHPAGRIGALIQLLVALGCDRHEQACQLLLGADVRRPEGEPWGLYVPEPFQSAYPCLLSCEGLEVRAELDALAGLWRHFIERVEDGARPPMPGAVDVHLVEPVPVSVRHRSELDRRQHTLTSDRIIFRQKLHRIQALETFGVMLSED